MTDKLEPTQADNDVTVALTEWLINREVFFEDGPPKLEKIMHDFGAFADDLIARHRATHSGEGRSYGVGEAVRIAKSLLLVIDGIEAHCRNEAGLKGDDHADDGKRVRHAANLAAESARQALATLTPQGDGEIERLRGALFFLASAEAEYRRLHDLHGDSDIRTGRAWDRMRRRGDEARAALAQPEAGGERA